MKSFADPLAQAEIERLRAENSDLEQYVQTYCPTPFERAELDRLRAKIARVEALAEDYTRAAFAPSAVAPAFTAAQTAIRIFEAIADREDQP